MRLYEFEGKEIFKRHGLKVPEGLIAESPEAAGEAFLRLQPCVIKSQVLVGGRGKAGGIKFPRDEADARKMAAQLLEMKIGRCKVKKLLVEKKVAIERELYVGITIDRSEGIPVLLACGRGGMDIEELAKKYPQELVRERVDILKGLPAYLAMDIGRKMGLRKDSLIAGARGIATLYKIFGFFRK